MAENGWNEWSRHVLKELERLNDCYSSLNETVQKTRIDIAMLKVKSGIWGALGGLVPVASIILFWIIRNLPR